MAAPTARPLRRDLRIIWVDGMAYSLMLGLAESYVPVFALALGKSAVVAGWVATLPMLVGALALLGSLSLVRRIGSHKRWVVLCVGLQALTLVALVVCAWRGAMPTWLLFGLASAYWALGLSAGPAWNAWVGTLVPGAIRANYFARRMRWLHVFTLLGLVPAGLWLHLATDLEPASRAFVPLFAGAALARMASTLYLARQSEGEPLHGAQRGVGWLEFGARLLRGREGRIFGYLLGSQLVAQIAQPFLVPYLRGPLGMDYASFMLLLAAPFVGRSLTLGLHGRIAKTRGAHALLWLGGIGIVPALLPWLLTDSLAWLCAAQLASGAAWAAWELAAFLSYFEAVAPEERTSVLTLYTAGNALAIVGGALLGGLLFTQLGGHAAAYLWLFGLSALLRLACLLLLRRTGPVLPGT